MFDFLIPTKKDKGSKEFEQEYLYVDIEIPRQNFEPKPEEDKEAVIIIELF